MRCKKCAYEIGDAPICPMCGTDQGHIKKPKKKRFDLSKRAFIFILCSGKVHKTITRNFIISLIFFAIALYLTKYGTNINRYTVLPIIFFIVGYNLVFTFMGFKNPGLNNAKSYKVQARFSTAMLIFYSVFCLFDPVYKMVSVYFG